MGRIRKKYLGRLGLIRTREGKRGEEMVQNCEFYE